jgi:two-component system, NtrC family, response regulator AtoC
MANILIVEDEFALAKNIARYFEKFHHSVEVAHDGQSGIDAAKRAMPDLAIVDYQLPGLNGLEVIRALRANDEQIKIVMVTGHASIPLAIDAMKAGSFDLLTKPVSLDRLRSVVERALAETGNRKVLDYYHRRQANEAGLESLVGDSAVMVALRDLVRTLAMSEPTGKLPVPPILVLGETGSGKELVARACHFVGARAKSPFVEINCAALPLHLMEGELFGYEKGAFTDAQSRKIGLIEAADGGTLFLDEIGELDLELQAKLLRVLENLKVRRLGALQDRVVNIRIVAATNRDLDKLVADGKFRSDLLYRLRVFQINIPPLRSRGTDLLMLARRFVEQFAAHYGKLVPVLDDSAVQAIEENQWLGNVRELRNVIERAVLLGKTAQLSAVDLGLVMAHPPPAWALKAEVTTASSGMNSLETLERNHLLDALTHAGWNVTKAARILEISRDTLRYRIDKHGLQPPQVL